MRGLPVGKLDYFNRDRITPAYAGTTDGKVDNFRKH